MFIDNFDQIKGLMDSIDIFFALKGENFGEEDYGILIGKWVENDEEFGVWGDSMDSEFCNEFLFEDGMGEKQQQQHQCQRDRGDGGARYSCMDLTGIDITSGDLYKTELENKEREIGGLRREFEEYKKMADFNMHKKFEQQNR